MSMDERYSRQIILENWNQDKIRDKTILIAGLGSLGSFSAVNFVLMGIGKLILIDYDTVELSNLNRQLLFTEGDIGKPKVYAAEKRLKEMNSSVEIEVYNKDIRDVDISVYKNTDVILDSLDSFDSRRWLNSVCVSHKLPLVHAALYGWWGNVQVVLPGKTACLECQPLIPKKRLQKYCSLPGEARKDNVVEEPKKIPLISTTTMVISGIQSQEALKILLEKTDSILENYLFYDGFSELFTIIPLKRNPNCIICGEKYRLTEIEFAISKDEQIRDILNRLIMTYGFDNPKILFNAVVLDPDKMISDYKIKEGEIMYVVDTRISTPFKLKCKFV